MDNLDTIFMKEALKLAIKGMGHVSPNPMVGAIIVKDGKIIAKGYHMEYGKEHAEVNAFIDASDKDLSRATMYVTLEPCSHYGKNPPCAVKIVEKGIKRVVIGTPDPNPLVAGKGIEILRKAGIEVKVGVLQKECIDINEIFMKYISKKVPFVALKCAMSLDGKIATSSGESKWISSKESRDEVQLLRKKYSAILVGINTVINDDPMLTCRIDEGVNPIRIVLDSSLRIPEESNIVKTALEVRTIVATLEKPNSDKAKRLKDKGIEVVPCKRDKNNRVSLKDIIYIIGELGIDSVLIEGGGHINYSALSDGVIDKLIFYVSPIIIGGEKAKSPVSGEGITNLKDAFKMSNISCTKVGADIRIEGYIRKGE